jgi:HEAT repeat
VNWSMIANLLSELTAISPMPTDAVLLEDDNDLADRYDTLIEEIRQQFSDERPSPAEEAEVVRVLADSFGLGGGMGVYWGTLHLIERCTPSIAYPVIRDRALHGLPGSRYWCSFILGRRRARDDLPLFLTLVNDDVPEVQAQALHALVMLAQAVSLTHVRASVQPLLDHPDAHVRTVAQRALDAIGIDP